MILAVAVNIRSVRYEPVFIRRAGLLGTHSARCGPPDSDAGGDCRPDRGCFYIEVIE